MVALVHIDRRAGDAAPQRAEQERRRHRDLFRVQLLRQRGVGGVIPHHFVDAADRTRRPGGQRPCRDRVHPDAELAPGLVGQGARVALQRRFGGRHAAAVPRDYALARHIR